MKTTLTLALLVATTCLPLRAQTRLSGAIRNGADKPLPFATVTLLTHLDSVLVKGTASDEQGLYAFENVRAGRYVVRATAVGYQKTVSAVVEVAANPVAMPALTLPESTGKLAEVQVKAKKPFVEQQLDRMVINVANSIVGSGSTALEVLEKSPGVTVDYQNERLQLRGKEGVIVQIDGKQSYLSAQDVIALLRSMSSDNIDRIELITNPSAKYDAAGNSGIINIRLKKNTNVGTNGTASLAGGSGRYDRERGGLQLNHRTPKLNLFGSYSLNREGNYWDFHFNRQQPDPSPTDATRQNVVEQFAYFTYYTLGQNAKAGLDFSPTKRTTIGVVWTGFWNENRQIGPTGANFQRTENGQSRPGPLYLQTLTDKTERTVSQNQIGNLNGQHSFGETHGQLNVDVDAGHFSRTFDNSLATKTLLTIGDAVSPAGGLLLTQVSTVDIRTAKVDYTRPLPNGWKLETGLKSALVKTDNDLLLTSGPVGALVPDPALSNRFQYTEQVNAAYLSVSGEWGRGDGPKTNLQVGLRAEHTYSEGKSLTLNQIVVRDYLKWFPSLFVSRPLSARQTLTVSYSYRIDRPNYQNLNPVRSYADPYAYYQGNPYLKPQFTHALEGKLSLATGVFASLGANYTSDLMYFTIHATEGNKSYVTMENLGHSQGYTLTLSWPVTVVKGWQLQTNVLGYYNRFQYDYDGSLLNIQNVAGRLNANNAFTLGNGWTAELNGWVSTPAVNGIWQSPWLGSLDAGVQKAISKQLTLKASAQDVVHTNRIIATNDVPGYFGKTRITRDTRIVLLNLAYSFGNQKLKAARQRRLGSEDETRRAN